MTRDEDHPRLKRILASAFSTNRVTILNEVYFTKIADKSVANLKENTPISVLKDYIEPYYNESVNKIIGVSDEEGEYLVASFTLAHKYFKQEGNTSVQGKAALNIMYRDLMNICSKAESFDKHSFLKFLSTESTITNEEKVAFCIPFFEMISSRKTFDLPIALINNVLKGVNVNERQLERTSYLNSIVEETLRLLNGLFVSRIAIQDTYIQQIKIKKGDRIIINIDETGKDSRIFDEPISFDPERDNLRHHLAFGSGPHQCLGRTLATTLAKTAFQSLKNKLTHIEKIEGKDEELQILIKKLI